MNVRRIYNMIQVIIFAVLMLMALITGVFILASGILCLKNKIGNAPNGRLATRLKNAVVIFCVLVILNIGFILYTQYTAFTPDIKDGNGNILEGSIAELKQVELNGRKQWISIRGENKNNPVLLFLAGGPGGSQMAAVRHELSALEQYFVVVGWDQPGSGKSYSAADIADITVDTYIRDGYALTNYLRETFGQEKIYLVGESWGSALGIFLIEDYPDAYHAFIGTGQMIAFAETECMDYRKAMELAKEADDKKIIRKLEKNGMPPYYGDDVTWKSAVYLNFLSAHMSANPEIHNAGYNTLRDIFSSEYGLLDKINYVRGIISTFNHVYQQLYDIDLRTDYTRLEVPVYFFQGRHDLNAPIDLVEAYVNLLNAPVKEMVWFEHSGHSPWINENDKFVKELIKLLPNYAEEYVK